MQLHKKKQLRFSSRHSEYALYNASGCLDTCKHRKRLSPICVIDPKISRSLTSGYLDIWIWAAPWENPASVMNVTCEKMAFEILNCRSGIACVNLPRPAAWPKFCWRGNGAWHCARAGNDNGPQSAFSTVSSGENRTWFGQPEAKLRSFDFR